MMRQLLKLTLKRTIASTSVMGVVANTKESTDREKKISELHASNKKAQEMLDEVNQRKNKYYQCKNSKMILQELRCSAQKQAHDEAALQEGPINEQMEHSRVLHSMLFNHDNKISDDRWKSIQDQYENCIKRVACTPVFEPYLLFPGYHAIQMSLMDSCSKTRNTEMEKMTHNVDGVDLRNMRPRSRGYRLG